MGALRFRILAGLTVLLVGGGAVTVAQAATGDIFGKSSLDQRIQPDGSPGFNFLKTVAGEGYTVRDGSEEGGVALGEAKAGRAGRRTPISYFGQLTDFQLADEESPARVEFLDPSGGIVSAAWRPQEALAPFEADQMMRQFNFFATRPPNLAGDGTAQKMDFVMNTGDISDSNQYNETLWNRQLIEGDMVDPNSGVAPAPYLGKQPLCPAGLAPALGAMDPARYAGVQDRGLWPAPTMGYFWDPDEPAPTPVPANPQFVNPYADAPAWPGLMDRAQQPFRAAGLKVPGYVLFGNHDTLVQGNMYAGKLFSQIATGCLKPINDDKLNSGRGNDDLFKLMVDPALTKDDVLDLYGTSPDHFIPVPPDPKRRFLSRPDYMKVFFSGRDRKTGHGFGFVDPAEAKASNGYAGYYSFTPKPGVRYIVLDTTAGAGTFPGSEGNLDDPQFRWFEKKLKLAERRNELAIVFSHHAIPSLNMSIPDENAPSCRVVNPKEVPGCDGDPRPSAPIHVAADIQSLVLRYPNAIAWVAGHSHVNRIRPYRSGAGTSGFWSIQTAALADWPRQNRLLELFDNRDGTISIFGTVIDHAAPVDPPAPGTAATGFSPGQLASIGRAVGYNDSQSGGRACGGNPCGEGQPRDRNAELLITDPRRAEPLISAVTVSPMKHRLRASRKLKLTVSVTNFATATAAAKNLKVNAGSSNGQVRVGKVKPVNLIEPGRTVRFRVTVTTTRKAKGKAKITVRVAGRKAVANLTVKPSGSRR